jgi:hypothetical protein
MRKRLAIITITALGAIGGITGAAAASVSGHAPSHNPNCPGADLTCKA